MERCGCVRKLEKLWKGAELDTNVVSLYTPHTRQCMSLCDRETQDEPLKMLHRSIEALL